MLTATNALTRRPSGIFVRDGFESIAYSDGEESERYLAEVFSGASDLSSTSAELEKQIRDWPSEYHLSAKRANILRGLNLPVRGRVLEIGCGCGAITRYLGEQGLTVDAVEGSRARAELAAMRCRGLDNVNITCANFNELMLPTAAYDLVVVVGVIEYAARFRPGESSDEDAVVGTLRSLKTSLQADGVIVVAIENRTGLKYVLGAHEDHYARRYIGIHNYPDSAGIRTYTRNEWSALIGAVDIARARYLFPFPDYKVPTVVLSEDYAARNPDGFAHLEGVVSRDYHMLINLGVDEPVFWQAASANGTLGAFSNSFLILASDDDEALNRIADIDFAHLPDFKRKSGYSVIVRKRTASGVVERKRVSAAEDGRSGLVHIVRNEPFLEGKLLSVEWSRSLLIDPWGDGFTGYLRKYYDYLAGQELDIDLVPNNILVQDTGDYVRFDREWEWNTPLDRDYILFRALMLFALRYKPILGEFSRRQSLYTVQDFVLFGFRALDMHLLWKIPHFRDLEQDFQERVNRSVEHGTVHRLLETGLQQQDRLDPVYGKLYWRPRDQEYDEHRSMTAEIEPSGEAAILSFELPADARNLSCVRFDPSDERVMGDIGFLQVSRFCVEAVVDGETRRIIDLSGGEQIAKGATLSGMVFNKASYGEMFAVVGDDPEIELSLESATDGAETSGYRVTIDCTHIRSPYYRLVRERYLVEEEILLKRIADGKKWLEDCRQAVARLEAELAEIKSSKLWKIAAVYRDARIRISPQTRPTADEAGGAETKSTKEKKREDDE